ncbi:MAG: hypothetical protein ACYSVY_13165 [Planctomycetota bacterium]|jgi:hypothetical protein
MSPWSDIQFDRRAGLANLAIAAAVALMVWLAWWLWQDAIPPTARQRDLTDLIISWKCDNGHVFESAGAYGSEPCPECGATAHLVQRYHCPEQHDLEASLRYERGKDGGAILSGINWGNGVWIEYPQSLFCPHCGRSLRPARPNLFPVSQKREGR